MSQLAQQIPTSNQTVLAGRKATAPRCPLPMPHGWFCIGTKADLEKKQVSALRYFDRDLVLFQTESGAFCLMDAYCPHLGAHLAEGGKVDGDCLRCPFHGWAWDTNGQCADVPYAKQIPLRAQQVRLQTFPITECHGLLYAWYHPNAIEPLWQLQPEPELSEPGWNTDWSMKEWVIKAHIQEIAENASDPAHFHFVHDSLQIPDWKIDYEDIWRTAKLELDYITPKQGEKRAYIHSYSQGAGYNATRFTGICETFQMGMATPIDQEHTHVRLFITHQPMEAKPEAQQELARAIEREIFYQLEQD
ncbi:MAG: Rieske 2Fe-2S domain-containing protein, partial [Gammaproteobacteria bacterium]